MKLNIYQIDAFANKPYEGNPAAVVPLETWLDDEEMQNIAMENNLSETVFFVPSDKGYHIRWFTPITEVDMCGHATLACAYVIFNELGYKEDIIYFDSKSGELSVEKQGDFLQMDFPVQEIKSTPITDDMIEAFGIKPVEVYQSMDYIFVFEHELDILDLKPDFEVIKKLNLRGVAVTSKSEKYDFVSRFFAPKYGIKEDPVTGSAYTQMVPYWSQKLDKKILFSKQVSKRGGELICEYKGERVFIKGKAVKFLEGFIWHEYQ